MRNFLRQLFSLLILLLIAACAGETPAVQEVTIAPPSEPTSASTLPKTPLPTTALPTSTSEDVAPTQSTTNRLQAQDFVYLGAFRLPGEDDRPQTFAFGGNAMTYNPDGESPQTETQLPGSLFIMGHDRIAYGEVPDGNQVAEVSIPLPVKADTLNALPTAEFLQGFSNVAAGAFAGLDEIPRVGLAYLNHPQTGPLLHLTWGAHLHPPDQASQAWFSPNLDQPDLQGFWFIGDQDLYSITGYLFDIPADWAELYTHGSELAVGRFRDGGMGGMGPSLFAYTPWLPDGTPAPNQTHLKEVPLLLYEKSTNTLDFTHCLQGYSPADEWEGGAWLTTASGKSAVVFAGTKATGEKTWYGYRHPEGENLVCVDAHVSDFPTCRTADGGVCPQEDLTGCCDEETKPCISYRGWWSNRFDAQLILYDPADLSQVALGEIPSWQPQPYAVIDLDPYLFLTSMESEVINLGSGDQRRFRIGDIAFDRDNGLLYVLELFGDGYKPLVHVFQVD